MISLAVMESSKRRVGARVSRYAFTCITKFWFTSSFEKSNSPLKTRKPPVVGIKSDISRVDSKNLDLNDQGLLCFARND